MARKAAKKLGFFDKVLEEFGEAVLDNHTKKIEAISTGCLSLDALIGVGGIPKGMITELFGPEGSGKTTIALNTAKQVANGGGKVLYIDVENLLNKSILEAVLGDDTNTENIVIITPNSAEDAFTIAEFGLDSGEFELVVIDTIGAMASKKEKENRFDKATMGQLPTLVSRFIKRNIYTIRTNNIAVLLLNQIRDEIGAYIKTFKTPGGHQLQHEAAVRISLTRGEKLKNGEEVVGMLTKFTVKKNKLAPPFRSYFVPLVFGKGIDYMSDFIDFSKLLGVIEQSGPYYRFDGENLGQGKAATRQTLESSKETLDKIRDKVYNTLNSKSRLDTLLEVEDAEESIE